MASAIYFNPAHAAGFATDRKLLNALQRLRKTNPVPSLRTMFEPG
jgi:hypothetical protein